MNWLVFSRNRGDQLDAFLKSAVFNAGLDTQNMTVLNKYDGKHINHIEQIKKEFTNVCFIEEADFSSQVLHWCINQSSKYIIFATDDAIFTRSVSLAPVLAFMDGLDDIFTFSLRLGINSNYCYLTNTYQKIQDESIHSGIFFSNWRKAEEDWQYPISVDVHVFRLHDLLPILQMLSFSNPNSMESNLQSYKIVSIKISEHVFPYRHFLTPH